MFLVKAGTKVKAIREGKEWSTGNFVDHTVKNDALFDKSELVVDPTGISKTASVPGCVTAGSVWAEAGWYGFRSKGVTILVPGSDVEYY